MLQTEGANDRAQLATLAKEKNHRILTRWMRDGVTIIDPATTWIDADVKLEPDVTILPGVQLLGTTVVAEDAVIGPDCTLKDVEVGAGAHVVRTHAELAVIGPGANVGPFSYLRPGTELGADGKIGGFVETKNAKIGDGAKVPHLSYVGDAEIGEGSNIGAGTIFANYDGVAEASNRRRPARAYGEQQHLRRPGAHRGRRGHGRRQRDPRGRATRGPRGERRSAAQHRGMDLRKKRPRHSDPGPRVRPRLRDPARQSGGVAALRSRAPGSPRPCGSCCGPHRRRWCGAAPTTGGSGRRASG